MRRGRARIESIKIDVVKQQTALVWIHEGKRRAGDVFRIDPEALSKAFDEYRLTCAKRAIKKYDFTTAQIRTESNAEIERVRFALRNKFACRNIRRCCHGLGRTSGLMNSKDAKNLFEFSASSFPLKTATAIW